MNEMERLANGLAENRNWVFQPTSIYGLIRAKSLTAADFSLSKTRRSILPLRRQTLAAMAAMYEAKL